MSENNSMICSENILLNSVEDDVDPLHKNKMATEVSSIAQTENYNLIDSKEYMNTYSNRNSCDIKQQEIHECSKDQKDSSSGGDIENKVDEKNIQPGRSNLKIKRKRRRRKSKRSNKYIPNTRTSWKYQCPRVQENRRRINPLVPYNTNKFLMEDHMPEEFSPKRRTRDSSFSIDSEENYFYSLPDDEEEFLTREFSNCYEDAKVERLESLTKQQLIQEYLQLQSSFDQLSKKLSSRIEISNNDIQSKIRFLEEKVNQLTSENIELRMRVEIAKTSKMDDNRMDSSEDSESDSSSSSSSSSCSSLTDDGAVDYTMVTNDDKNSKTKLTNGYTNGEVMDYKTPPQSPNENNERNSQLPVINNN